MNPGLSKDKDNSGFTKHCFYFAKANVLLLTLFILSVIFAKIFLTRNQAQKHKMYRSGPPPCNPIISKSRYQMDFNGDAEVTRKTQTTKKYFKNQPKQNP